MSAINTFYTEEMLSRKDVSFGIKTFEFLAKYIANQYIIRDTDIIRDTECYKHC